MTTTMTRRGFNVAVAALAMAGGIASAFAQSYPSKPITIIVPFPPGGASDITARAVAASLEPALGQPIVIENKPGANGGIGASFVKQAKPDGYTLLVGSIGVYAINPVLYPKLQYDPPKDFDLLTVAVRTPNVLVASTQFAPSSVSELIAQMKKTPGTVTFASSGAGSSDHLTAALFWQKTGTSGLHVPYKGGGPAITDLIGGHANVSFQNLGAVSNHIKAGKLKLLAVASDKRTTEFPDAPTLAEAGVSGVEVFSWQAVAAPKGLPPDVKTKLEAAVIAAVKNPATDKRLSDIGFQIVGNSSAQFGEFLNAETARWREVVTAGKITVDQ
jgi:tripartite-type tricarboxylate transporter receptor subunit TctC